MTNNKWLLTNEEVFDAAKIVGAKIFNENQHYTIAKGKKISVYGVPRGGIPAAYAVLLNHKDVLEIADTPEDADVFVDDLLDSGATMKKYNDLYPGKHFYYLFNKQERDYAGQWLVFPWEGSVEGSAKDFTIRLLQFVGEDVERGGLKETPARVAKAWQHWTSGYGKKPEDILKVFEDGGETYDEMVTVKNIPVFSHCEHHLAAIFGTATVSYIPNGHIVGLSKINRLVDMFARRLQVQERLTDQIGKALWENLKPKGVGVSIKARHFCIESRGVQHSNSETVTTSLFGVMKDKPEARAEFLRLCK